MIPPHTCYVEPFCGAAHVLFGKPPSKIEVLNDRDGELMNFFRCAQSIPDAVARAVASMPHSRKLHGLLKRADLDLFDPIEGGDCRAFLARLPVDNSNPRGFK